MFKRLFATALVFGTAALAPPVFAQESQCLPREALIEKLQMHYGERLTGGGLQSPQQLLEAWSSDRSGSFTIFLTRPDGFSCVVATGQNWNSATEVIKEGLAS